MQNVDMDTTDLENPQWKKRTRKYWKGNHRACGSHADGCFARNGWQICMDEKRTDGNVGQVLPLIIDAPVSGQFATSYTVVQKDEDGDVVAAPMHKWDYKGWRLATEAKGVKPADSLVQALTDKAIDELRRNLKEDKVKPTDAQDEMDALRVLIYRANGMGDPDAPKTVQIMQERKAKRQRKGTK